MTKTVALIAAALTALAALPTAAANPPNQWEQETVESLQLSNDPTSVAAFTYAAPAATCQTPQGFTRWAPNCPDIFWLCPDGITAGALTRYRHDLDYNRAILGYQTLDSMCIPGPPIEYPNPQPPPPAVTPTDAPPISFTG